MNDDPERPRTGQPEEHETAETQAGRSGRLRIFFGYATGVGKTRAMLEAACQRKAEGIDVIVACADARGKESDALMKGLPIWPRRRLEVGGNAYMELDLDGILARCPPLAVVDELAHSNAPGSRHPRRFQDAEELLAAGIDVYATVNVQNLESLSDIVSQITGV